MVRSWLTRAQVTAYSEETRAIQQRLQADHAAALRRHMLQMQELTMREDAARQAWAHEREDLERQVKSMQQHVLYNQNTHGIDLSLQCSLQRTIKSLTLLGTRPDVCVCARLWGSCTCTTHVVLAFSPTLCLLTAQNKRWRDCSPNWWNMKPKPIWIRSPIWISFACYAHKCRIWSDRCECPCECECDNDCQPEAELLIRLVVCSHALPHSLTRRCMSCVTTFTDTSPLHFTPHNITALLHVHAHVYFSRV
jgi:hypothetical protein